MFVRNIINIIFNFSVFYAIFLCVGYAVFSVFISKKLNDGKLSVSKKRIFGMFMELDNLSIFAITISLFRFIFLLYMILYRYNIDYIHLNVLLVLAILFGISSKSLKNLVVDLFSSGALYFALFSSKLLSNYLVEVQTVWYVVLGNILLLVFVILYSLYFSIRNVNDVVSRTKYIRRYRNEDN